MIMLIENISIILSLLCLLITLINVIVMKCREQKIYQMKIKLKDIEFGYLSKEAAMKRLLESKGEGDTSAEEYLRILYDKINEIYPDANTRISIRVIKEEDLEHPENSKVITWISYPKRDIIHSTIPLYSIKNSMDLHSIYIDKKDFVFIGNLREFNAFRYNSDNQSNRWNAYMTCPISKSYEDKKEKNIIGFLSISSTQDFNNVKKNELIMDLVQLVADRLYNVLLKEEGLSEIITKSE